MTTEHGETRPRRLILDVDTGTDDAGALLLAVSHPGAQLEAVLATWGNCAREQVARNTRVVLEAAGVRVPVHLGAEKGSAPAPFDDPANEVMGADGLGGIWVAEPQGPIDPEPAATSLVRRVNEEPGELTLVALAPLTTVAAALELDQDLPSKLADLVVMGGAIAVGGNVTPAAESNVAHDPTAAARVFEAFGAPGAMSGDRHPFLVPLDVTRPAALTRAELDALGACELLGAGLVHRVFTAAWPSGLLETGRPDVWPAHDLLATWCAIDPGVCGWSLMPIVVDLGGDAGWGSTIGDRSFSRKHAWDTRGDATGRPAVESVSANRWAVAMEVDAERYQEGVRAWLEGAI